LNRRIPGREEFLTAADDLANNLKALNVDAVLGKEADMAFVKEVAPDAVVIATGGKPTLPDIPGVDQENVVQAWDVLAGKVGVGNNVVIVGGNAVGLETALYLASLGTLTPEVLHFLMANRAESPETIADMLNKGSKTVTVVEMMKKVGQNVGSSTRWTVMAELKRLGVTIMTGMKAVGINPEGLEVEKEDGMSTLPADSIVMAAGTVSENTIVNDIENLIPEVYTIGDAKEPRKALEAVREGFLAGLEI
jgi:2,4-dienoyl-CoA reductase (NADPH2)